MSGKGFEEDNQTLEILRLALGWTKSEIYVLTMHWLIVGVEMYLFWPLYPNFPHVWGDSVMGMVMIQYVTGVISYASMSHPLTALTFSHIATRYVYLYSIYITSSVAYILFLIVAEVEDNVSVDWISHMLGLLALAFLVAIVSVEFAIGFGSFTSLVCFWYIVKHFKEKETLDPSLAPISSSSEKLNLVILMALGGAIVFVQIGLAMGLEQTKLSPIYFGFSFASYVFFRFIEVLEGNITVKSISAHISRCAGILSLCFFVGLISQEFAIGIFVSTLVLLLLYLCKSWCKSWLTNPTAQDLADEVQTLLQFEDIPHSSGGEIV
ncbi:hypothetical protein [Arabidopsis thaliana]|uniref:Transmembrane protein n=1 Tax=Arabidopsis thaliana TaxID=3702 RepID=Q9LEZ7_ARATH|nr:uncharacterized protein AT5G08090 [Arabidopsis thaliana]AED91245.1 transmembrane protein [Arabidopsis thaliana]CAB93710.1 hypothetical protein [Arabidopsis thaliana]|eukprot:NP_196426.1 transmembrane protein [Arabidopsis thaliana]